MKSTFSSFVFATAGETPMIDAMVHLLETLGYTRTNRRNPGPGEFALLHDGYELVAKDRRGSTVYRLRQDSKGRMLVLGHWPGNYHWFHYLIVNGKVRLFPLRDFEMPYYGDVPQDRESISIMTEGFGMIQSRPC